MDRESLEDRKLVSRISTHLRIYNNHYNTYSNIVRKDASDSQTKGSRRTPE
jgi:hypothetical protein